MGQLVSITVKPDGIEPPEGAYLRISVDDADLVDGYGVKGDMKGGAGRNLNILCSEALQTLAVDGYLTQPGKIGEQLIIQGISPELLVAGAMMGIGESARVRMTKPRTGCDKFERYQSKSREGAAGRLGMMAEVVAGGQIRIGDHVRLLEPDTD